MSIENFITPKLKIVISFILILKIVLKTLKMFVNVQNYISDYGLNMEAYNKIDQSYGTYF